MAKRPKYPEAEDSATQTWPVSDRPIPGLRDRDWPRFIEGPDPRVLIDLYIPALQSAVRYDRCCAYFSSSVLAAASRGFAGLIQNLIDQEDQVVRPAIRLLVNEELSAADAQKLQNDEDPTTLEKTLLKRFKTPKDALEKDRLAMLAWLLHKGWLEMKVGVMRYTGGISHAKYGYVTDNAGDMLLYRGSGNETAFALSQNYEQFEISLSWQDQPAVDHYQEEFEQIWLNKHPSVRIVDLPTALREKLLKLIPDEPPIVEPMQDDLDHARLAMKWMFMAHAGYLADDNGAAADALAPVNLWPHQRGVVDETVNVWPEGRLLCDEVGMGKTIEAIMIIRRLLAGRGARQVLFLVPAGLLGQWQDELREKGGLLIPYLKGEDLIFPDESKTTAGLAEALKQPLLLMSREAARRGRTKAYLRDGPRWDLVLMDEAHAARRKKGDEGGFNTGNLLLELLRDLQLSGQARSILLLSATPMQIDPYEPWDLLCVLGMGGYWASGFGHVEDYYDAIGRLHKRGLEQAQARRVARLLFRTGWWEPHPLNRLSHQPTVEELTRLLRNGVTSIREANRKWLEANSPLKRFAHRNTRDTLRRYYHLGLLSQAPPRRKVDDQEYDYATRSGERQIYQQIKRYIDERYDALEEQKPGKGFVMTVYRRRMASSPVALLESLRRRRAGLNHVLQRESFAGVLEVDEQPDDLDLGDAGFEDEIGAALPETAKEARQELRQIEPLIHKLEDLGAIDSKRDFFLEQLQRVSADGRSVLVFTNYLDTMDYLREQLQPKYHDSLACYSGRGGEVWDGERWKTVAKSKITQLLDDNKIRVLLCNDAASEGLNLQAAGALINYDMPWNPSRVEQRIGRIDRIGQKFTELPIINLYLKNSVDTRVYRVLRERCGLFEHFVGPMQPILGYARRILETERETDVEEELRNIHSLSDRFEEDRLVQGIYSESGPEPEASEPPFNRSHVALCIKELIAADDPSLTSIRGKADTIRVKIPGLSAKVGLTSEALDLDPNALPFAQVIEKLAIHIHGKHPLLPLVVGTAEKDSLRVDVCLWISEKGTTKHISTFTDLQKAIDTWTGHNPSPDEYHKAAIKAKRLARKELRTRVDSVQRHLHDLQSSQFDAGKARLRRELGLNLFARNPTTPMPAAFTEAIQRSDHSRFRSAFNVLGGVECWEELDREEIKDLAESLTPNQRKALDTYRNIDLALGDPRITGTSNISGTTAST